MTDMTMPDIAQTPPPPPPKKSNLKVIIPVVIVVILCCICLIVVGIFYYMGRQGTGPLSMLATDTPTPTNTATRAPTYTLQPQAPPSSDDSGQWYLYFDWECGQDYEAYIGPLYLYFYDDLTCEISDGTDSFPCMYTTEEVESMLMIEFWFDIEPYADYVGVVDLESNSMSGAMSSDDATGGCWYAVR